MIDIGPYDEPEVNVWPNVAICMPFCFRPITLPFQPSPFESDNFIVRVTLFAVGVIGLGGMIGLG